MTFMKETQMRLLQQHFNPFAFCRLIDFVSFQFTSGLAVLFSFHFSHSIFHSHFHSREVDRRVYQSETERRVRPKMTEKKKGYNSSSGINCFTVDSLPLRLQSSSVLNFFSHSLLIIYFLPYSFIFCCKVMEKTDKIFAPLFLSVSLEERVSKSPL